MFREPEGGGLFETNHLSAAPKNDDEVSMDSSKDYGAKDTSGPLSSVNPQILVAATNPLSSYMYSRSVFPTKIPSFSFKCDYLNR